MFLKKIGLLLSLALVLSISLRSQVLNDDCMHALSWGTVPFKLTEGCFDGSTMLDTVYIGDNINAAVNFPYPQNPMACQGYTPNIAAPANDVWYVINAYQGLALHGLKIGADDTVHVSFWVGDSCQNMVPVNCYTVPALALMDDPNFTVYAAFSNIKIFVQVSGVGVGHFTNFRMWMGHQILPPVVYNLGPTPVLCFAYQFDAQDASSLLAHDGSATAHVTMGNPPYSYHWSDNSTDSTLHNASTGWYYVTITDAQGCFEEDSVFVGNSATAVMAPVGGGKWNVWHSTILQELFFRIEGGPLGGSFQLFDVYGAAVSGLIPAIDGAAVLSTEQIAAGTYLWIWTDDLGNRQGGKVLLRN